MANTTWKSCTICRERHVQRQTEIEGLKAKLWVWDKNLWRDHTFACSECSAKASVWYEDDHWYGEDLKGRKVILDGFTRLPPLPVGWSEFVPELFFCAEHRLRRKCVKDNDNNYMLFDVDQWDGA